MLAAIWFGVVAAFVALRVIAWGQAQPKRVVDRRIGRLGRRR